MQITSSDIHKNEVPLLVPFLGRLSGQERSWNLFEVMLLIQAALGSDSGYLALEVLDLTTVSPGPQHLPLPL